MSQVYLYLQTYWLYSYRSLNVNYDKKQTTKKEGNMKPIRSNELEHYKEEINKKFRYKAQAIESEIQQEAQTLSDKKKPSFQKLVKVDKKMSNLIEAEKKYKKHLMNKDAIERKL